MTGASGGTLAAGVRHPFLNEEEHAEARDLLAQGWQARAIADWFGLRTGPVGEWIVRERERSA